MSTLQDAFYADGTPRCVCFSCGNALKKSAPRVRAIDPDRYRDCALRADALANYEEHKRIKGHAEALIHTACYKQGLLPRRKEVAAALPRPVTRQTAAKQARAPKAPPPVLRQPRSAAQKVVDLRQEATSVAGVVASCPGRNVTRAQASGMLAAAVGAAAAGEGAGLRGFHAEAIIMRTVQEAFEAFDESGLEPLERALRLVRRSHVIRRLLGNSLLTAKVHRGSAPPTLPAYCHGFTRRLLISWLCNADSRLEALERLPVEWRARLCERAFSSDCCEMFFPLLVSLCGGKASVRVIKGAARRINFMHRLMQAARAARGFSMRRRRTRGAYKQHELLLAATMSDAGVVCSAGGRLGNKWNCASKIINKALERQRWRYITKRADTCARGKQGSTRTVYHNNKKHVG